MLYLLSPLEKKCCSRQLILNRWTVQIKQCRHNSFADIRQIKVGNRLSEKCFPSFPCVYRHTRTHTAQGWTFFTACATCYSFATTLKERLHRCSFCNHSGVFLVNLHYGRLLLSTRLLSGMSLISCSDGFVLGNSLRHWLGGPSAAELQHSALKKILSKSHDLFAFASFLRGHVSSRDKTTKTLRISF